MYVKHEAGKPRSTGWPKQACWAELIFLNILLRKKIGDLLEENKIFTPCFFPGSPKNKI
jgi:hypothetical protein